MASSRLSTLKQQVGQLIILGFDGVEMSPRVRSMLAAIQPAGVILFRRNVVSAEQTHALLRECQASVPVPLFRCVDLEGGTVDRLRDAIARTPAFADVASTGSTRLVRAFGRLLGDESRALGFNVDFAPVSDLRLAASLNVLTSRTASADPHQVVDFVSAFLKGFRDARVLGCGKHFPGLGGADLDPHKGLPVIDKKWDALWDEDLLPYRKLKNDLPFVMVAHALYPRIFRERTPSSLSSRWIADVLRKRIGYRGLVVSDDLEMGGAQATVSIEQAAVGTIAAGGDLYMVCNNEAHVWRTYIEVLRTAEKDRGFARRVAEAARRVVDFKRRSREVKQKIAPAPTSKSVEQLRRRIEDLTHEVRTRAAEVRL